MSVQVAEPLVQSTIIDNLDGNTLYKGIRDISGHGRELCIATAFFSLDALNLVGQHLHEFESVRLLFGSEASKTTRRMLIEAMRQRSDQDLLKQRDKDPLLKGLEHALKLIEDGKLQARCYTKDKFHAKAYLAVKPGFPPYTGILGSGNFTRQGLTENIELNAHLTHDQAQQLKEWFELRWEEAEQDEVTEVLKKEIERQTYLYDPYIIYQKALLTWGKYHQGSIHADDGLQIKNMLDPHQALGYSRALEIINREHGVMICDGVGLGKSFIALALMEHFCRANPRKNVLLIAPKSIMESSWSSYLETHLEDYRMPFGNIHEKSMTDLGFDLEDDTTTEAQQKKQAELKKLIDRVDVIVVDESHNFRSTNVQRYLNLKKLVQSESPLPEKRKKVILLTATPINTKYQDLSAQLALISQDFGTLAGFETAQITSAAKHADVEAKKGEQAQKTLDSIADTIEREEVLRKVLESVVIQRKRTTCIDLAKAVGKTLTFPIRENPQTLQYELSDSWKSVVHLAHKRFAPTAAYLKAAKAEYRKAEAAGLDPKPVKAPTKSDGIKFAAFLPEQYRTAGEIGKQSFQYEVFLAGLVFTNTMKQLESSPAAFQGILQSLGTSLMARLKHVVGDSANADLEQHSGWVNTPINALTMADGEADIQSGEDADLNGAELDAWLNKAIESRHLAKKLAEFTADNFNVEKWRKDILHDLAFLKEIHRETIEARQFPDHKLLATEQQLRKRLDKHQRVVVFTQSQRTSFYLEKAIQEAFPDAGIARIDSNVKQETRSDILYAFCPNYNPRPKLINRERVDILICTDVLSEGVNMQEAECILNYDIHWNPVRLIQRIGRVDRRLDPEKNPVPHSFSIINCLPPDDINDIIKLVDTVEDRTTQISKTLGIDQAFFKATDPAGTLKEFNKVVDGEPSLTDKANERYVAAIASPDPETLKQVENLPPGAFSVWENAPANGIFALFEMGADEKTTALDREHFRSVIGAPILALECDGNANFDGPKILDMLEQTVKGERSGKAGNEEEIKETMKRLRNKVNQSFRRINLSSTIQPRLVCAMELRRREE
ncbi:MAG TPA: helicase-related protein [Fimbriimonas sp.]|nr:helicase-related protein [Fimbriimonas sp.]